jgi:hypothetical protein
LSRPIMVRSRRESHHSDGITDQKSLQPTSATKSAMSRHRNGVGQAPLCSKGGMDSFARPVLIRKRPALV